MAQWNSSFLAATDLGDLVEGLVAILILLGSALTGGAKWLRSKKEEIQGGSKPPEEVADEFRRGQPKVAPIADSEIPEVRRERSEAQAARRSVSASTAQESPTYGVERERNRPPVPPPELPATSAPLITQEPSPIAAAPLRIQAATPQPPRTNATREPGQAPRRPNIDALRRAIVLSEILAPPLCLRSEENRL